MPERLRMACCRFASCGGCQLTLLNCEQELAALVPQVEFVLFPLLSSAPDDGSPLDLALVEGAVMSPEQSAALLALRRRAKVLVAVGACALSGGVQRGIAHRSAAYREVYQAQLDGEHPPLPLASLVAIDLDLPGCPPEGTEIVQAVASVLRGGIPAVPAYPVCMECIMREQRCLLRLDRLPCLGPITRAGCGARCPGRGVACEGCRGRAPEANLPEMRALLQEVGLRGHALELLLQRFGEGG